MTDERAAAPRPPSRARWFARWAVPAVLVPALAAGSIAVSSGSADRHPDVDRFAPLAPGTTWVYETTTNGEPTGLEVVSVAGRIVYSTGESSTPAVIVRREYENFIGQGPASVLSYLSVGRDRVEALGQRYGGGDLRTNVPPEVTLQAPLVPGATWEWRGTSGDQEQSASTTVGEAGTVDAAGERLEDCLQRTRVISFPADDSAETAEEWICPGVGLVRSRIDAPASDVVLEEELVAFSTPGRRLGSLPGALSLQMAVGGAPGLDPGRSNAVPGGELDLAATAWSDVRNQTTVFPAVGDEARMVVAEVDGFVSLTDLATGEVRWRLRLPEPVVVAPVLAGDLVLAAGADKALTAIDAERGVARWSARFPDLVSSSPAILGDLAVVTTEDRAVRGLDPATGSVEWTAETGALVTAPPVVAGELAVVVDDDGGMSAYREDGSLAWTTELDDAIGVPPASADGLVVTADVGGLLAGHDAATGEERWRILMPGYRLASAAPAVADRIVVVSENTSGETFLTAYRTDGVEAWDRRLPGEHDVPPVVVGDRVVVLSEAAVLRAFRLEDGVPDGERRLGPLDPAGSVSGGAALGLAGSALVAQTYTGPPWGSVTYTGIPAGPEAGRDGVVWEAGLRVLDSAWRTAGLAGDDLVWSDFDGDVWAVGPGGPRRRLADGENAAYAVGAGPGLALAHVDGEALAIDPSGGSVAWRVPAGDAAFGTFAAASEGTAYVPVPGEGLAAVDLGSGRVRWRHGAVGQSLTGPAVLPDGDAVYTMNGVVRLDEATGRVEWRGPAVETFGPVAAAGDALAVVGLTETTSELIVLEAGTGAVRWRTDAGAAALIGPGLDEDAAVTVDDRGLVRGFDAATGEERWSFRMRTPPCGTPVLAEGRVLLTERGHLEDLNDRDYRVTALDARTGRFLGSVEPLGTSGVFGDCRSAGPTLILPGNLRAQLLEAGS